MGGEWQSPPCEIRFPLDIWQAFPDKQALINEVAYAGTLAVPLLLKQSQVVFDTAKPRYLEFYQSAFQQAIPNLVEYIKNESSEIILSQFQSIDYQFDSLTPASTLSIQKDWQPMRAILPLSFGKDSLLTLAAMQEQGYEVIAVNIDERTLPRMHQFVERFIPEIEALLNMEVFQVDNEIHMLSDYELLKIDRSYLYQAQVHFVYHLLMLPFCYFFKAPRVLQSNELINSLDKKHREGFITQHKVMQSEAVNKQLSHMLDDFTQGQIVASNPIAGVGDYAINALLYNVFPQLPYFRISCHMEVTPHQRWCHDCVRCAHAYLNLLAMGKDPFDYGFEHSMLTEDKRHHFRVFDEAVVEQDIFRRYYQNEEILAFYQAYERGHNEALIMACLQQYPVTKENIKALKTMMLSYQYVPDNDFEQGNKQWFERTLVKLKALL